MFNWNAVGSASSKDNATASKMSKNYAKIS